MAVIGTPAGVVPARYVGTVYLLHFDRPYQHARHYLGWTQNVTARLAVHRAGQGARLLEVVHAAGIGWTLARTWRGTRHRERQLKRQGGASRLCPLCGVHPRPDQPTVLSADQTVVYQLRELTDLWWEATTDAERDRLDAEHQALAASRPTSAFPSTTEVITRLTSRSVDQTTPAAA